MKEPEHMEDTVKGMARCLTDMLREIGVDLPPDEAREEIRAMAREAIYDKFRDFFRRAYPNIGSGDEE